MSRMNNLLSQIIDFEEGNLSHEEVLTLFQTLVDSGMIWELQGTYIRYAMHLATQGEINFDN